MSTCRVLYAYFNEAKYECIRVLRTPAFVAPFFVLPAALYLLFGVFLFGDEIRRTPHLSEFLYLGFSVFGVMGPGMFGFGVSVATEREQGLVTLKRALPMPAPAYLIAKMFMSMIFACVVMVSMILSGVLAGHPALTLAQMLLVAGILVLGSLPFCAMGLFIGTRVSAKSAPAFVNLAFLPLVYLSGVIIMLPPSVQWISRFSPAFYLEQIALRAAGLPSYASPALSVSVLAAVTLLPARFAIRRLARIG
ncbi:MAG TPA: ABC transporter permease [Bryobacteraceae bacterium]|nr:ABC transporter permease [Bryobacteraceae bacterium]